MSVARNAIFLPLSSSLIAPPPLGMSRGDGYPRMRRANTTPAAPYSAKRNGPRRFMRLGGFEPPTVGLEVRCSSAELQAPANRVSRLTDGYLAAAGHMLRESGADLRLP